MVLIIEDDLDMVEALRIILGSKGYEVVSAASGDEGFEMVKAHHPDIIILDVMMEKPIKPKEFLERVERLLSRGGQTDNRPPLW